jgi:hypothetical protein
MAEPRSTFDPRESPCALEPSPASLLPVAHAARAHTIGLAVTVMPLLGNSAGPSQGSQTNLRSLNAMSLSNVCGPGGSTIIVASETRSGHLGAAAVRAM